MAFPQTLGVELFVNGAWQDITSDVYNRDSISVTRGRANEGGTSEPAEMNLTLDNITSKYSPRNPSGPYFGQLGRNTPIRFWVRNGLVRQRSDRWQYMSCPDTANLSITGDIDLRADISLSTWRPNDLNYVGVLKSGAYGLYITEAGKLAIGWWSGGAFNSEISSVPIPGGTTGRKAVRATLDVNNGAGGHTATFYYSNNNMMSGTWVQFSQVIAGPTTAIDDSSTAVETLIAGETGPGEVFQIQIYSGIAGTLRANPIFTSQTSGATSFSDGLGNTWSNSTGGAGLDDKHYRFWGHVATWPPRADTSGNDRYVSITASGVTRRIGQGNAPAPSPLRRAIPTIGSSLVGYWPLEDLKGAAMPESVVGGTARPRYIGNVEPGAYTGFPSTLSAPHFNNGRIWLSVKPYANTDYFQVRFLFKIGSTTIPNNTVICRIWTNSSLGWIDWIYQTGDLMFFKTYNNYGTLSMTSTALDVSDMIANEQDCLVSLEFKKNGTGVDVKQVLLPISESVGFLTTDTNASITLGACTRVYLNPDGVDLGDTSVGQVRVENAETSVFDLYLETAGFRGELALERAARLCTENSIEHQISGRGEDSEPLGVQDTEDLLSLLQATSDVDGGIMTESRVLDGIKFRSRESLSTQDPMFTISYADNSIQDLAPVDDDQATRNKVTVSRESGTTATVEDDWSPMGTADPPAGVGLYDDSATLSLYHDDQAEHQAGWRVNLGTVDEYRFPQVTLELAHPDIARNPTLLHQILSADIGDRIVITNPPADIPPENIDQIIQGINETVTKFSHVITFNCSPAKPYRVAQQGGHPTFASRYSNLSTTLAGTMTTTSTSVSVAFSSGKRWTIADGSFDVMVNGERMTVTNITGTTSPQTWTVTRSVNGVVKAHSIGEGVRLFDEVVYGITGTKGSDGRYLPAREVRPPDPIYDYGNAFNTITATSWSPLPTTPLNVAVTNPHPTRSLMCMVSYGGWGIAVTNGLRAGVYCTRANSQYTPVGPDSNGTIGWGEIHYIGPGTGVSGFHVHYTTILEPAIKPYVFTIYAYRDAASGTQEYRYPTIRVVPLNYI